MSAKMSSKERVMAAISFEQPDRVPIDYACNRGIDTRLKEHFGLDVKDDDGLLKALDVDFRHVGIPYIGPRLHPEVEGCVVDPIWGIRRKWIEHQSGGYFDYCDFPLKDATMDDVENWPMPSPDDYDYCFVKDYCKRHGEYALYLGGAGLVDIINMTGMIRTMEQVLVDLITDEPVMLRWTDRRLAIQLEIIRRALEAADGAVDMLFIGEDLGTQIGQILSLELFRRHLRPRHQQFVDLAKSCNLPVMIHSCGASSWAFEDFIEMGISVVDTLQPEAKDMSPEYLKKRFGGRLAFHGCISTAGPVAYGTADETESYCRDIMETMMPGGGYCFAPTHQLQDNSPTENVLRMYQAAQKYGRYA